GSVGDRYFVAIGARQADVVKAHGNLRHNFQCAFSSLKYLVVDRIAKGSNQAIDAGTDSFQDQRLGRSLRPRINLKFITKFAKPAKSSLTDITGSKHPKLLWRLDESGRLFCDSCSSIALKGNSFLALKGHCFCGWKRRGFIALKGHGFSRALEFLHLSS